MGQLMTTHPPKLSCITLHNFIAWMLRILKSCIYLLKFILSKLFHLFSECNANCKNNICNSSGFCTEGCVEKYWGPTCNSQCPVNCKEPTCYDSTGLCVTCISGFWGDNCTLHCSSFCYGKVCHKTNGNCVQGCLTGRYGDTCDKNCSYGCVGVSCNKESGICTSGCKQNWAGNKCDSKLKILYILFNVLVSSFTQTV